VTTVKYFGQGVNTGIGASVKLSESNQRIGAAVCNMAGPGLKSNNRAEAAEYSVWTQHLDQLRGGFDSILQGNNQCVRPDHGAHCLRSRGHLPGFHGTDNVIDDANIAGAIGNRDLVQPEITSDTVDPKTGFFHRLEMGASCDKGNILPGLGKTSTKIAADSTTAENCDAHHSS
jgi:hypothetical protein